MKGQDTSCLPQGKGTMAGELEVDRGAPLFP